MFPTYQGRSVVASFKRRPRNCAVLAGLSLSAAVQVATQAMGELDLARRADSALPIRVGNPARELPDLAPPSTCVSPDSAR